MTADRGDLPGAFVVWASQEGSGLAGRTHASVGPATKRPLHLASKEIQLVLNGAFLELTYVEQQNSGNKWQALTVTHLGVVSTDMLLASSSAVGRVFRTGNTL